MIIIRVIISMTSEAFDFDNIFLNKKSYEILILLYEL